MKLITKMRLEQRLPKLEPKSRGLNLSHHRHSGRLMPHTHTSYPALAMLLLLEGVLLTNSTRLASALVLSGSGSYQVTAAYLGPPPATAATIDSPTNGQHFKATPITVNGTCPSDTYIMLTRNGVNSGTAICGPLNTYSLQTDLFSGANALQVHVFSKFDVEGPVSTTVTVVYDAPVPVTPVPSTAATGGPTTGNSSSTQPSATASGPSSSAPVAPLLLKSNFKYVGHNLGQSVSYLFELVGGTAPYAVNINWGDGTTKTLSLAASGPFTVNHTYEKASQYSGSYKVIATAGDSSGNQTLLQLLAIINDRPVVPVATTGGGTNPGTGFIQLLRGNLKYIWATYGVLVLMIATFWLGELRELDLLRRRQSKSRHA